MNKIILFSLLIIIGGCKPSLEKQARKAAGEFCNCIKENIFSFQKAQQLFSHCYLKSGKEYRLLDLYFQKTDNLELANSLSQKTKDSISEFMAYFGKYSDSCYSLPVQQIKGNEY